MSRDTSLRQAIRAGVDAARGVLPGDEGVPHEGDMVSELIAGERTVGFDESVVAVDPRRFINFSGGALIGRWHGAPQTPGRCA